MSSIIEVRDCELAGWTRYRGFGCTAIPAASEFVFQLAGHICVVVSGSVAGIFAVWLLGHLIGLVDPIILSSVAKSVTIPIAVGISNTIGGIPSLTVCATIITGIFGATVGPAVLNLFRVKHDAARGMALGTAAHGAGVQQALQANRTQGAMAGLLELLELPWQS